MISIAQFHWLADHDALHGCSNYVVHICRTAKAIVGRLLACQANRTAVVGGQMFVKIQDVQRLGRQWSIPSTISNCVHSCLYRRRTPLSLHLPADSGRTVLCCSWSTTWRISLSCCCMDRSSEGCHLWSILVAPSLVLLESQGVQRGRDCVREHQR